jgi:hypothetical protein
MVNSDLRGIELDRASRVGEEFDVEVTRVLPYLELSDTPDPTSSALSYSHAYGKNAGMPVFAGSSPSQTWVGLTADATPYPWVRFWARRFNDDCTGVPSLTATTGAASVSITCADFLELPVITDGWRQVTLRFGAPPTLTGSGTITWSSPAATGAQWQILVDIGQDANGNSNFGTGFSFPTYVPDGLRFFEDTPYYFVQDPPTVTGVAASLASTQLTPISLDCGTPGACIPTGMGFVVLNWTSLSTSSASATGTFGYYEVQRQDDVDSTWETVATFFGLAETQFLDREARVGVASRYRVRVVTDYGIEGPFSATVTATIPQTDAGLWLFSSNFDVLGFYAFAAPEVGSSQPQLAISYYEGSSVTYQEMFGRNNRVAFHPRERGGETFSVTLLPNQGASGAGSMGQYFARFRSLAWSAIEEVYGWNNPYVCVRDGEGNRWYADVTIPASAFDRRKPLYNHIEHLNVTIVETLDDPVPFDNGGSAAV